MCSCQLGVKSGVSEEGEHKCTLSQALAFPARAVTSQGLNTWEKNFFNLYHHLG